MLGTAIGEDWTDEAVDLVVGPAPSGILLAHEVARYLGTPCLYTERVDEGIQLGRGFAMEAGV